jgi:hypothetical protein
MWYKLVDKIPVEADMLDPELHKHVQVGKTILPNGGRVSTVFLRLDHRHVGEGDPILFESMYFPNDDFMEDDCVRYCTWEEAVEGHREMVEKYGGVVKEEDIFDEELFEI